MRHSGLDGWGQQAIPDLFRVNPPLLRPATVRSRVRTMDLPILEHGGIISHLVLHDFDVGKWKRPLIRISPHSVAVHGSPTGFMLAVRVPSGS